MSHILIDDQDLSRVTYNGTWIRGGSALEHESTVASSTVVGDSFTVDFNGTSIVVYGTIDVTSEGVITSYAVDSALPAQITSQGGPGDTFNQQFWKSPTLSVGEHTLKVQMLKVNPDPTPGEGTIWFDYFLATDPTIRSTTTTNPTAVEPFIIGTTEDDSEARTPSRTLHSHSELISLTRSKTFHERPQPQSSATGSSSTTSNVATPEALNDTIVAGKRQATTTCWQPVSTGNANPLVTGAPENPEPVQHVDSGVRTISSQVIDSPARPVAVELPPVYSPV
ncbi:unnamed protein product [Cyclocybe aegerita]|uniref:Uncharacterized protein n=1 Tax=Cyclocybe aegerita TaxID=1973307 RepID=A0A8S0XSN4_CYCAE|nr:unnamed protein product [Cyclocybe aegerita]